MTTNGKEESSDNDVGSDCCQGDNDMHRQRYRKLHDDSITQGGNDLCSNQVRLTMTHTAIKAMQVVPQGNTDTATGTHAAETTKTIATQVKSQVFTAGNNRVSLHRSDSHNKHTASLLL